MISLDASRSELNTVDTDLTARLKMKPVFCPENIADPFDTVEWTTRTATIKGDSGTVFFEQNDCEFPSTWSQLSVNVVASKYFYGEPNTPQREKSIRQLIHRVSRTITDWGVKDGYFASPKDGNIFYRELTWLLLHQYGSFNSPVWFNVGLYPQYGVQGGKCTWHWDEQAGEATQPENPYEHPQASACFIQSVADNMEAIMDLARSEAMLFKFGSGTGTDLSTIRSSIEKLAGGGNPSGPLSFMRVYDQIAAVVKSGGKTRRAAKMQSLKVTHPDIMNFIDCKFREEEKAKILMKHGLPYEEAYASVLFQNANLSVRLTDDFMQAVKEDKIWATHWVTNATKEGPTYPARQVFDKIANTAWACGDPGVQYDTIINRWHTTPNSGRINASNPCSEYMSIDDTACNLASINLMRFRQDDGLFDAERFIQACRIFFIAQEIIIDRASYPIKKIAENSHRFRAIGLGYSNLGSLIMSLGLPYDSDEARGLCSVLTALMNGAAYRTSAELAGVVGAFETFDKNREPMLRVIDMHWDAVNRIGNCPNYLKKRAQRLWDEVRNSGSRNGFRNAQATVLAPTGTISFMMDCDTTGIEPDIALVKFKQLAGGGTLKIVNNTVPLALRTLGYTDSEITAIIDHIQEKGTLHEAPHLVDAHLPVFDCAFPTPGSSRCIAWEAHVKMMAAAQPFISGAISKTVNMPNNATAQDIADAYMMGWELGLKALAVYRDGSKGAQPLSATNESDKSKTNESEPVLSRKEKRKLAGPRRERLPDTRQSVTHKFNVSGHEGYITVGLYPDGRVGELFITMAKEGSTIGGLMDCFGTAISMSLQYGVPLSVYIEKFSHTRFEPLGHTKNPDIPIAKSLVDYIFRWLGRTFLPDMQSVQQDPQNLRPDHNHKDKRCGVVGKVENTENTHEKYMSAKTPHTHSSTPSSPEHDHSKSSNSSPNSNLVNSHTTTLNSAERMVNISVIDSAVAVSEEPEVFSVSNRLSSHFSATTADEQYEMFQSDAPLCDACGAISVRAGNCYLCYNCGKSMGCS
jgi:ribonucleoside-diphosphate reductase alpha chain